MSVLPLVVLCHDQALIKLAHGITLVIYFYFIMQLLSMYVLVHNSFEYFNLLYAIGEIYSIGVSVVLTPRLLVDIPS